MLTAGVLGALCAPLVRFFILYWAEPGRPGCPRCGEIRRFVPPTGRCPRCRARLGPPAGLVEVVSAVVLLVLGRDAMALWCVGLVGVCLAFVDVRVHRLPNVLTLAFFAGALVFAFDPVRLGPALLGAAVAAGLYLVLAFGAGFGLGDAKLAAGLGVILGWYGWTALLLGLAAGLVLSGLFAAALLAVGRAGRRTQLAHGPFMLLGGLLAVALVAPACPPICLPIRTVLATLPSVPAWHA